MNRARWRSAWAWRRGGIDQTTANLRAEWPTALAWHDEVCSSPRVAAAKFRYLFISRHRPTCRAGTGGGRGVAVGLLPRSGKSGLTMARAEEIENA